MICCSECFSSSYLKDIINRNNELGKCDFCGSENTYVYNPTELSFIFKHIVELYTPHEKGKNLGDQIDRDFPSKIFSKKIGSLSNELLQHTLGEYFQVCK